MGLAVYSVWTVRCLSRCRHVKTNVYCTRANPEEQNTKQFRHIYFCVLRYCATSRKVAGSIPDGLIGIFH